MQPVRDLTIEDRVRTQYQFSMSSPDAESAGPVERQAVQALSQYPD